MTLNEYLIKLGFSVDEPSLKKFAGAVAGASAHTAELGSVAIETAAAVELMVSRVARTYENLYYVSQRTNQSVRYIQGTQFAFKQIGLSAEEANSSIEGIAATMRTQPWLKQIFGGATKPQEIAGNLAKSGLPYFLQVKFAEMVGLSEHTLFQMQKFAQVEAAAQESLAQRQRAAGLDPEKLAKDSANYGRALNQLEGSLSIYGDVMASHFLAPTQAGIEKLDQMVQWLSRVDTATQGWSSTLLTLAGTGGGLFIVEKLLRRIFGLSSATAGGKAIAGLTGGGALAAGSALLTGGLLGAAGAAIAVKQNDPEQKKYLQEMLGPIFYELGLSKSPDLSGGNGTGPGASAGVPAGQSQSRVGQAVAFFKKAGFSDAAAQGIAAGLFSESGLNPSSVNKKSGAYGIGQWLTKDRVAGFERQFNKPLQGSSFEEQLQYVLYELQNNEKATGNALRGHTGSARDAAGKFIGGFERPGAAGYASDMRTAGPLADSLSAGVAQPSGGDKNIMINSKADFHFSGDPSSSSTARQYVDAHNGVNDNLVRNLSPAVR